MGLSDDQKLIRRLRKKLRQIEHLENDVQRPLNHEERQKVARKEEVRNQLAEMKRRSLDGGEKEASKARKVSATSSTPSCTPLKDNQQLEITEGASSTQISLATPSAVKSINLRRFDVVTYSPGHEDLCTACDIRLGLAVTASRDTTLKVWRVSDGKEMFSLRGHTNHVTCVAFIQDEVIVSGSLDCTWKIWCLKEGKELDSVYTYNGIKCLTVLPTSGLLVVGTESGKVEVYDTHTKKCIQSLKAHEDTVMCVSACGNYLASGCRDGSLCIFDTHERLEEVHKFSDKRRSVISVKMLSDNVVVFGGKGKYLNILNWKSNQVCKMVNNRGYGFTDSLSLTEDSALLLSASYDIDTGFSSIFAFDLVTGTEVLRYNCFFGEKNERIFALSAIRDDESLKILASVGSTVKIFKSDDNGAICSEQIMQCDEGDSEDVISSSDDDDEVIEGDEVQCNDKDSNSSWCVIS